jgi:hypothetical protein
MFRFIRHSIEFYFLYSWWSQIELFIQWIAQFVTEALQNQTPLPFDRGEEGLGLINAFHLLSARGVETNQGGRPGLFLAEPTVAQQHRTSLGELPISPLNLPIRG